MGKSMKALKFSDVAVFDSQKKSVVSVRDGVLEYLGSELDMEPADKIFYVYRSPATIASAASLMPGIPLLGDHIEPGTEGDGATSKVESASLIDAFDEATASTLAIRNMVSVDEAMQMELESGKRELSLGYTGSLVPHHKYDFEQRDITPTHLAVVEQGRCGSGCRFLDRKPNPEATMPKKLHKAFCDAEGALSLSQIVELAAGLPEAIKNVPADKLAELLPALQEIMAVAEAAGVKSEPAADPAAEEVLTDEESSKVIDEEVDALMDEAAEAPKEGVKVTDSMRAVIRQKARAKFVDKMNAAVSTATAKAVKEHAVVIDKARDFVDEAYCFTDKSTVQIMRDALAVEHGATRFTDAELPVAFKLLKKASQDYKTFGDHAAEGGLTARLKASLKEDQ